MSNNNPVDKLIKKVKSTSTSKSNTRSQTHDNELTGTTLDQRDSMVTDAPELGFRPVSFIISNYNFQKFIENNLHLLLSLYITKS